MSSELAGCRPPSEATRNTVLGIIEGRHRTTQTGPFEGLHQRSTMSPSQKIRFVCNGRVMPDNQNKISSVAYQFTRGIDPKGAARISAKELRKLLEKLGVKDQTAPGWKIKLPNGVLLEARPDSGKAIAAPARAAGSAAKAPAKKAASSAKKAPAKKRARKATSAKAAATTATVSSIQKARAKKAQGQKRASSAPPARPTQADIERDRDPKTGERPSERVMREPDEEKAKAAASSTPTTPAGV